MISPERTLGLGGVPFLHSCEAGVLLGVSAIVQITFEPRIRGLLCNLLAP